MRKLIVEEVKSKQKITPIWFMRQAGRYLKEYRELRNTSTSFIELCLNSDLMKEITLQPVRKFNVDAAIIFSDILIVPYAMGLNVEFVSGHGPLFSERILENRLSILMSHRSLSPTYSKVFAGIKKVLHELILCYPGKTLIGFAGSPFTVLCYLIEGAYSKDFINVKKLYFNDKKKFQRILHHVLAATLVYLKGQIDAGVDLIKLFDSWAGILSEDEFEELVIQPNKFIVEELKAYKASIIVSAFPRGAGVKYRSFIEKVGADIIGIDHTVPLTWARDHLQSVATVQGNLDNVLVSSDTTFLRSRVLKVLRILSKGKFIFNLGHGVLPDTKITNIKEIIDIVKNYER